MNKQSEDKNPPGLIAKLKEIGFDAEKFEPKVRQRFIVKIPGIPSYTIKSVSLPTFRNRCGDGDWTALALRFYNPIETNLEQKILDVITAKSALVTVQILDPVGNVITTWNITTKSGDADFGVFDWEDAGNPNILTVTFDVENVKIEYPTPESVE